MKFKITWKAPVMFMTGGKPIASFPEIVPEERFWAKMIELNPEAESRKAEILDYLKKGPDRTVMISDYMFNIEP